MVNPMRVSRRIFVAALAVLGVLGLSLTAGNKATAEENISQNIHDYVADKLDDFSAIMRVDHYDEHEGEKINKDFGYIYKLKGDVRVRYKEENKMRLDAQVGASKLTLIVNQTTQYVRSSYGIKDTRSLGNTPGKRKTLLDAGFISAGYLAYTEAEFKRTQEVRGVNCAVFRISYKDKALDTSHRLVWIDPKTKIVIKREEYSQQGKVVATYWYLEPKEVARGIWFPTRIEAYNRDNKQAGVTVYRDVQVNQGLDESVFSGRDRS
jgi:outer membrane lipoprotein-sorting protein